MNLKKPFLHGFSFLLLLCAISCKNEKPVITIPAIDNATPAPIAKRLFYDSIPTPTGYINDYEHIFNEDEIDQLEGLVQSFKEETTIEIAVVTFDSAMTTADSLDAMTLKVANEWKVGTKNNHNGIVIGLSKHWRKLRIENGKGIAKILSDKETKKTIDEDFIPLFKRGNYFEGVKLGLLSLMRKLREKYTA